MVETHFLLENLGIPESSIGIIEKFQYTSDLSHIKFNCVVLFLRQIYSLFIFKIFGGHKSFL